MFLSSVCVIFWIRCWMAVRASILGCRLEHYRMKKMKGQHLCPKKNPQNRSYSPHWVCLCTQQTHLQRNTDLFEEWLSTDDDGNCSCLRAALSKPHLFEGRGHNRQGSDSSVDRFMPKDEPAELEPDNKVKTHTTQFNSKQLEKEARNILVV